MEKKTGKLDHAAATKALTLSDRVQIREVTLTEASLSRSAVGEDARLEVDVARKATAKREADAQVLRAIIEYRFAARDEAATGSRDVVRVLAKFEAVYSCNELADVSDDVYHAFAEMNGVFNTWPYFREFLQASLARMNLPVFTLPVFRVSEIGQQGANADKADTK